MSFPRYPKYRPSGVEWLGEVPEHWMVCPLKRSFRIVGGGTPDSDNEDYWNGDVPWATPADLGKLAGFEVRETQRSITADGLASCNATLVPAGSLVLSTRAPIGSIGIAELPMSTNQGCKSLLASPEADSRYYANVLLACTEALQLRGKGTTFLELSGDELGAFKVPAPPSAEQRAIAAFLDRETAKIDALVAEQERLIELLKEKRQAVISHAVTKGLDPTAPMKPSGIEWLGDVPIHWHCTQLVRVAERVVVGIAEAATHAYMDTGTPILRSTNIRPGAIVGEVLYIDPNFAGDRESKTLRAKDLVTVRTGNAGVTAVVPEALDGCQCFTMLITTLQPFATPDYYCFWMNSIAAQCYFSLEGWGTAQVNISVPILKALPVPVPPREQQESIVAGLHRVIQQLDSLSAEAQGAIELLSERRSALISAAVTGQIDVRNAVPVEVA